MEADDLLQLLSSQQARRLRVIENLLRGRRTVSTLFWGQRYRLLYLLDLGKALTRGGLDGPAQTLVDRQLATWEAEEQPQLRLTPAGVAAQHAAQPFVPQTAVLWPQLDINAARKRLLLGVQVVSEYQHQTKRYYPLATDLATRQLVRRWFYQSDRQQLGTALQATFTRSLARLPERVATVTVAGFTGYRQPGLTNQQLAVRWQTTAWQVYLMHIEAVVTIAQAAQVATDPLAGLLGPLWTVPVTKSAQATLAAVQAGGTLDQIARQRRIKPSTVREHLLEAAIMLPEAAFPYERLLPATTQRTLLAVLPTAIDEWTYTDLAPALQAKIDFFTFRLLAIWQDKRGDSHGKSNG